MGTPTWKTWTAHATTRKVYVDASYAGGGVDDDINQPYQTLAQGMARIRDGFPDWLLLKCGEVWAESFNWSGKSGLDATNRIVVTSYGTGARPLIKTGVSTGIDVSANFVIIDDLEFYANGRDINDPAWTAWPKATTGNPFGIVIRGELYGVATSDVTVQNCKVRYYDTNIAFLKNNATAIGVTRAVIQGNVSVRAWGDVLAGEHGQGIYCENLVDGLIDRNFCDYNGSNEDNNGTGEEGQAQGKSHGMYLLDMHDTTVTNNMQSRSAFLGIKCGTSYGIYTPDRRFERCDFVDNLTFDQPSGISVGGHASNNEAYYHCTFTHNVLTEHGGLGGPSSASTGVEGPGLGGWQRGRWTLSGGNTVLVDQNLICHGNTAPGGEQDTRGIVEKGVGDSLPTVFTNYTITGNVAFDVPAGDNHSQENPSPGGVWGFVTGETTTAGKFIMTQPITQTGNVYAGAGYTDSSRTVMSYLTSIGETATWANLYSMIDTQRRQGAGGVGSWDARITADAINSYLRAGFDMSDPVPTKKTYAVGGLLLTTGV